MILLQITLQHRKTEALKIAQKCINILKDDFGATEVILFGSLRGDSPWHEKSDLDLAVKGLSEEQLWQAYGTIEKIVPHWLKFDLVSLEEVPDYIRDRILETTPMSDNQYLALQTRLNEEMLALEENVKTLNSLLDQAKNIPEIALKPALAGYITDFYTGCERLSERVAVALDGGLPQGENWHQQLLCQMADPGGNNRPPLWQGSLLLELDEYRKFRHLTRHNYQIKLKGDQVLKLAQKVNYVSDKVRESIGQFNQWLAKKASQ
ncbi:MAG TPA: DNA polymerase subunit beta [Cyanothece sp. UBA12306]|nr:DNA polymerase subunit beta [Cyanothece sp. UBA12306]